MLTQHASESSVEQPRTGWWNRLFFSREVPYGLAIIRIYLPLVLLIDVLNRWRFARELFSTDGAPAPLADNFRYLDWLPVPPGTVAVAGYTALVFFLIASSLGWWTRVSLLAAAVLYPYFTLLDCMTTITKYTVIASHMLLVLALSNVGTVWSIDSRLRRRGDRHLPWSNLRDESRLCAVWPQRLIQFLVCAIYFGAAMTKMRTSTFLSGDQLRYWMLTHVNGPHPVGEYLTQFPLVLLLCALVTLVWEVVFPFVVSQPRTKWLTLGIGILFHLMTVLTLGLFIFPQVMLAAYCSFLTDSEVQRIARFARRYRRRVAGFFHRHDLRFATGRRIAPVPATAASPWSVRAGAFAMSLAVFTLAGVELEYRMDPYGERGLNGPLPLKELSQEKIEQLMEPVPLRQPDKFFSFDLGARVIGDHLVNYRRDFRPGETLFAQVCMNQPHEDMWLECTLADTDGKLLNRFGQVAMRESFRVYFSLPIDCALPAGEYNMVLSNAGEEIMRRRFNVLAADEKHTSSVAPAAN
jgi:hypothetical protein